MNDNGQYVAAVERCETLARSGGHILGVWYRVNEHLHAVMCDVCGAMAVVVRPGCEQRWRTGGTAMAQVCLEEEEEDRRSGLGA